MAPQSAAIALREARAVQGTPEITRKIKACVACRKLKIKCFMDDDKPPCKRCKGRGLSCTVNKSIQMILDSDISWKNEIQQRVEELERQLAMRADPSSNDGTVRTPQMPPAQVELPPHLSQISPASTEEMQHPIALEVALNTSCNLGAFPASALTGNSYNDSGNDSTSQLDLVSKGVISESVAQQLYTHYQEHLNHLVYNLLGKHVTLPQVRTKSSLLASAIYTVAAYCSGHECYEVCLLNFQSEISSEVFIKRHTFNDVRALCIGSLWLPSISAALSSLAVRFAMELNLHRCITKMPHTNPDCYERTRLYFIVLICDHQCSLLYGRPPMTRAMRSLKNPRALLQSRFSVAADIKLISHLELWTLNSRVLDSFGADVGTPLRLEERGRDLHQLGNYFTRWREQWTGLLTGRQDLDAVASPILETYYHASRLCLFAHIFRGPPASSTVYDPGSSQEARDLALAAVESAQSFIYSFTTHPSDVRSFPAYFYTILAYAITLILAICTGLDNGTPLRGISHDKKNELHYTMVQLSDFLSGLTSTPSHAHISCGIAKGLKAAILRHDGHLPDESTQQNGRNLAPPQETDVLPTMGGLDFTPGSHTHFEDMSFLQEQFSEPITQMMAEGTQYSALPSSAADIDWSLFPSDFSVEFPGLDYVT